MKDQIYEVEMGGTCGTYVGRQKYTQDFGGEFWNEWTTWKTHVHIL